MKAIKVYISVLIILCGQFAFGQEHVDAYAVYFTPKAHQDLSYSSAQQYLSQRAIDRRVNAGIPIRTADVPIESYRLQGVSELATKTGPHSKWLNALYVEASSTQIIKILDLPYVSSVAPVCGGISTLDLDIPEPGIDYGSSLDQIAQINLDNQLPHQIDGRGDGMLIAVLDAGFVGGDAVIFSTDNPVIFTKNYVNGGANVYQGSSHGFNVLSTMAANLEGYFYGTAPKAEYALFKTEDEGSETPVEMFNWVAAAEFADSMGADLINSSLGYYTFDDPSDDYSINDLDGRTSIISLGALGAARTGMLVVTSAGNEGQSSWGKISFPADADSILSVGSVNQYNMASAFSSRGYTVDGRIKPNVCARGEGAAVLRSAGDVAYGNGTSFSSPILCGAAASLWSIFPQATAQQVLKAIEVSSSHYYQPNVRIGYGVPNFAFATKYLGSLINGSTYDVIIYPNPFPDYIELFFPDTEALAIELTLFDLNDRVVAEKSFEPRKYRALWAPGDHVAAGTYVLRVVRGNEVSNHRIIKLQ